MRPLVLAGVIAALLSALAVSAERPPRRVVVGRAAALGSSSPRPSALCPRGTLPDADVCVPVPAKDDRIPTPTRDGGAGPPR